MPNEIKHEFIASLVSKFGQLRRLPGSQSLFELPHGAGRLYLRYSRQHTGERAFFGLRQIDLNQLDGHNSFICFFSDNGAEPFFVPHHDFAAVIRQSSVAADGQYKVQIFSDRGTCELYIPRVGRFNIDAFGGDERLEQTLDQQIDPTYTNFSHSQVQTLVGAIGRLQGYSVYVPPNNVASLDWSLVPRYNIVPTIPRMISQHAPCTTEIDVIWLDQGDQALSAVFEVEHSTPVYSGLLRFNDILTSGLGLPRFFIVSNESRRDLFSRQVQRTTFQRSGLSEITSFLDYANVFAWFRRLNRAAGKSLDPPNLPSA